MMAKKRLVYGILIICICVIVAIVVFTLDTPGAPKQIAGQTADDEHSSLPTGTKPAGEDCREHDECQSGVCDHYKADMGYCAPTSCATGDKADNNNFFCNNNGVWEQSKAAGERCTEDYQCYQPTCFMIPTCDMTNIPQTRALCKDSICTYEIGEETCASQGMKRVLRKDQYMDEEQCIESMAQMILPTVCAPCGNGVCDEELESECNCPEDCEGSAVGSGLVRLAAHEFIPVGESGYNNPFLNVYAAQ